ncbi:MAG: DUF1847 domain-containing protein [Eubacteriales bacterium]|nr:DUF1847 domain-containing protein [Eubacteriales bacterium]
MHRDHNRSCVDCGRKACRKSEEEKYPEFCLTKNAGEEQIEFVKSVYLEEENQDIMQAAAKIQAETYGTINRVEETIQFAKEMGYKKIGIATCTALLKESQMLTRILRNHGLQVFSACCKVGAVPKAEINIPKEHITQGPNICNPVMQAEILNKEQVDMAIVMGLCVGHDILFHKYIKVPTTTLVVKDRVLAHNPVAALYTTHSFNKNLLEEGER